MQDLTYNKKYDNGLRQVCKSGGAPEGVLEHESVKEQVDKIVALLKDEEAEQKALQTVTAGDSAGAEEPVDELEEVRKPPSQHSQGSEKYWKAVANQTVRTYVSLHVLPKTLEGVISVVSQSSLKEYLGEGGVSSVLIHLDLDSLGESLGPGQRPLLRKRHTPDGVALRNLLHGALIARGGQRRGDECSCPPEGDLVFIHCGFDRSSKEAEALFRPLAARKDQAIDAEMKEVLLVFSDASIRSRKQRVRGAYSSRSTACLFSGAPLSSMVPEKPYSDFSGYNFGDVFSTISALQTEDLWHLNRTAAETKIIVEIANFFSLTSCHSVMPCRKDKEEVLTSDRCVSPTEAAAAKAKEVSTESVFSAAVLPCAFYRSFLKAHSVKAVFLGGNVPDH